jgi:ATP-dependent DNA helicase RecG
VAFANTAGGRLVLGLKDDHQILGIPQPLDEEERLCSLIADGIAPRLVPNIELVTVEDKTLLLVEVCVSGQRPHWLKAEGPEQGVYVRLGSTNRQADRELIAELRRSVEGPGFDEMPMPELSVADLDLVAAGQHFGGARALDEGQLLTLRLLCPYQGRLVPTKGAVLLFGKERLMHFPDAWVQCGRFFGVQKIDIFDHIDIDQPLPKAVDEIMLFLKKHAFRGADLTEIRRKDVWSIPLSILREVVINALVHADYSQRGAPVRVVFLDDRIEVENPGILLPGLTLDDVKQGFSKIRNTVIARVFRELDLIEQWGTGVPRIFAEANLLGLPEPRIEEIGMRVRFSIPLGALGQPLDTSLLRVVGGESGGESNMALRILRLLQSSPHSKADIARAFGKDKPNRYLDEVMKSLLDREQAEYTLPDKPNSRLQQYRLTAKGRALLNQIPSQDAKKEIIGK